MKVIKMYGNDLPATKPRHSIHGAMLGTIMGGNEETSVGAGTEKLPHVWSISDFKSGVKYKNGDGQRLRPVGNPQ